MAGGIGVFVRSEIVHLVELVENKCVDSIWVKISKNQLDEEEDIFIGTYYISPQNSKQIPKDYDFFSEVNAEISYFGKKKVPFFFKVILTAGLDKIVTMYLGTNRMNF